MHAAHRGALRAGVTYAVFGSGLDFVYPRENRKLAENTEEKGALVSEFPLGTPPSPENFPIRNRIIAGMSLGVVVVEAAEYSGSLITARLALEGNREVFAVPGNITSPNSFGPHVLIRQGAKLVAGWQDIIEELPHPDSRARAAASDCANGSRAATGARRSRKRKSGICFPCTRPWRSMRFWREFHSPHRTFTALCSVWRH